MKYYVYQYIDPRNLKPFYIGKGTGSRYLKHLKETSQNTENRKKYAIIEHLRILGLEPIIEKVKEGLTETEAYAFEEQLIRKHGRRDLDVNGILCNICIEARPPSSKGKIHSDEFKKHLSETRKGSNNPMFGRKQTQKYFEASALRKGANNFFFGKTHSKEKMTQILETKKQKGTQLGWPKGKPRSKETKTKLSSKWLITELDGSQHTVTNLNEFAKERGIHPEVLRLSSKKKRNTSRIIAVKLP